MSDVAAAAADSSLSRTRLILRPFGYAAITVVWLALFLVMVLLWAVFFLQIDSGMGDGAGLQGAIEFVLIVVIVSPVLGPALVFLTGITLSLTVLAALAFVRSLRPGYAREPLTTSIWSSSAIGTPVYQRSAISLIPVRATPFARFWAATMLRSFLPSWPRILGAALIGAGYLITVGWIKWPVSDARAVFWAILGGALILAGLHTLVRSAADRKRTAPRAAGRAEPARAPRPEATARDLRRLAEHRRRKNLP